MSSAPPKYLTGDKPAIQEFIQKFDVSLLCVRRCHPRKLPSVFPLRCSRDIPCMHLRILLYDHSLVLLSFVYLFSS